MTPANRNDDRRVRQLAVKNLLHEAATRGERVPDLLQELYRDASSCRLEEDAELLAGPFAETSRHVFSPPHTAFRDPCLCPGGGFLGVEVYGQRLMRMGFDSGLEPVCVPFGASAITRTKEGFAALSAPDQQVYLLDENLAPLSCCAAQERVGVLPTGGVEVDVDLDLADLAALELRPERLVLVLHQVGTTADDRAAQGLLGR